MKISSYLSGLGMNVPKKVVKNDFFATYLETSDEWIKSRTGIEERRWAEASDLVSELALPACLQAINQAGISKDEIDGVIFATVTPDKVFPSSACCLQKRLNLKPGFAFDINAVCSGFIYALITADSLIAKGLAKHVLVIGADLFSQIINMQDRATCVLFGDGAGAVVLSKVESEKSNRGTPTTRGIISSIWGADGNLGDILCVEKDNHLSPELSTKDPRVVMNGKEVFKVAVRKMGEISLELIEKSGVNVEDIQAVICHQANKRILDAVAKQLNISLEKMLSNVEKYGNTSAASVPILLAEAFKEKKVKTGDLLLMNAFGGGVTWGAVLLRL